LWKTMLFVSLSVLAVYFAVDLVCWRRETPAVRADPEGTPEPLRIEGSHNLLLLGGVLAGVICSGLWPGPEINVFGVIQRVGNLVRDFVLLIMLALSWQTTSPAVREANEYSWAPIREVAILFAGIFVTIIPALAMLRVGEQGGLAAVVESVRHPVHFFWASGALSSFLDNAPTYLAFLNTALGRLFPGMHESVAVPRLMVEHPSYLAAISTGSVFMGANTYIGNAPNFMVKSIAEESGVPMPSFFGYILRYSLPVLIPIFAVAGWIFFPQGASHERVGRDRRRRGRRGVARLYPGFSCGPRRESRHGPLRARSPARARLTRRTATRAAARRPARVAHSRRCARGQRACRVAARSE